MIILINDSQKKYQRGDCDKMTEFDAFRQFLIEIKLLI
jgi:hypothetical protein